VPSPRSKGLVAAGYVRSMATVGLAVRNHGHGFGTIAMGGWTGNLLGGLHHPFAALAGTSLGLGAWPRWAWPPLLWLGVMVPLWGAVTAGFRSRGAERTRAPASGRRA